MRVPGLKRAGQELVRVRGRLFGGGVILGYHRVARDPLDPHDLVVGPEAFREQLEVIRRSFRPVRLGELIDASRDPAERPVALTFDDGYADVLHEALPFLERYEIPATVFVVSGSIGRDRFPWDEDRSGVEGRPLDVPELRRLAASGHIEIGGHTRRHPDLRTVSAGEARLELRHGRARLEELLARRVESFAFPHGGTSPGLRELAERAGYRRACVSRPGLVTPSTDPLHLPRFWPPDVGGVEFERWLSARTGISRRLRSGGAASARSGAGASAGSREMRKERLR